MTHQKRDITAAEFRSAVQNREFCVLYQPQVDMQTGKIVGAEALVRWHRPGMGLLSPDMFIPVLEQNGMMPQLDCEVFCIVEDDVREAEEMGISLGYISVNMSRLHAGWYGSKFVEQCTESQISRDMLLFELTETAEKTGDDRDIRDFTERLRENGFRIAIDDYGMGSSTLKMLHQISFDILKLDRYFVNRIGEGKSETIIQSTVSMAEKLGMEVVAEGIETSEQAQFLLKLGCKLGQGYYYSKPLPRELYYKYRAEDKVLPDRSEKNEKEVSL